MDRADMERAVREAYAVRLTNDIDGILNLFWGDALIRIAGKANAPALVTGGRNGGSLRHVVETLVGNWHWLETRFFNLLIDGNRAATHYSVRARFTPTGEILDAELFDFATLRDGKIAALVEFRDTAAPARRPPRIDLNGSSGSRRRFDPSPIN